VQKGRENAHVLVCLFICIYTHICTCQNSLCMCCYMRWRWNISRVYWQRAGLSKH